MTEDFLHYIWKYKLFNVNNLLTSKAEPISILSEGFHNDNSGPDFSNAKITIGELTWAGNVEIHIKASDWYQHGHHNDPIYGKAILHVVWENDKPVYDTANNQIPTLILKGRVSKVLVDKYEKLILNRNKIMCADSLPNLNEMQTKMWLGRLLVERLERKVFDLNEIYKQTNNSWEQTLFIVFCRNMGFKTNADAMTLLAKSIDFNILLKNRDRLEILEAILFGTAGFLGQDFQDVYPKQLKKEFKHQQSKFNLEPLGMEVWKFGKIRPFGFPTLRLSQLAKIIHVHGNLFHKLVRDFEISHYSELLNQGTSEYWNTHYKFDKLSAKKKKGLGGKSVDNLLINTVAPILFFYGKAVNSENHQELALNLLEKLPLENNFIIRNWVQNNIFATNASESQSLIELTNSYCTRKKCLNCGIGKQVLNI